MDSISGFTNLSCDHHIVACYLRGIIPEVRLGRGFADRNSVCSGKVGEMTRMQAETQAFQKTTKSLAPMTILLWLIPVARGESILIQG